MIKVPTRHVLVSAADISAVVTDLHPGTNYNCSVFTIGSQGNSELTVLNITTPEEGGLSRILKL